MLGRDLLCGPNLELRALRRDDLTEVATWYQDGEFLRCYDARTAEPQTVEQLGQMYEDWLKAKNTITFALRRAADNQLIGLAQLDGIDHRHGVAGLSIALGPSYWGQGLGSEGMRLLMRYGFMELNLHRLQLTVFEYNERALALYRKLGFQHEGTFREFLMRDGRRWDMHLMSMLASEWHHLPDDMH